MSRNLVSRSDKKAFWGVVSSSSTTYTRMRGFTDFSGSKNPKEYSRQYVDEKHEQTDVVGYSPSWSFGFDEYTDDAVLQDIAQLMDNEVVGSDAVREIVFVDFSKPEGTSTITYPAVKRSFSVIGDSEGSGTDAYTYSGNLKVKSEAVTGTASIATPTGGTPDTVETITFSPAV